LPIGQKSVRVGGTNTGETSDSRRAVRGCASEDVGGLENTSRARRGIETKRGEPWFGNGKPNDH
jgi:hypothetical protein